MEEAELAFPIARALVMRRMSEQLCLVLALRALRRVDEVQSCAVTVVLGGVRLRQMIPSTSDLGGIRRPQQFERKVDRSCARSEVEQHGRETTRDWMSFGKVAARSSNGLKSTWPEQIDGEAAAHEPARMEERRGYQEDRPNAPPARPSSRRRQFPMRGQSSSMTSSSPRPFAPPCSLLLTSIPLQPSLVSSAALTFQLPTSFTTIALASSFPRASIASTSVSQRSWTSSLGRASRLQMGQRHWSIFQQRAPARVARKLLRSKHSR